MIKVRVAMEFDKDNDYGSEYVEIMLPCLPRLGEFLFLSDKHDDMLKKAIINNPKELKLATHQIYTRKPYYTNEQKAEMEYEQLKELAIDHLCLSDLIKVNNIIFDTRDESDEYGITIHLGS
jgi:hypothetical protein